MENHCCGRRVGGNRCCSSQQSSTRRYSVSVDAQSLSRPRHRNPRHAGFFAYPDEREALSGLSDSSSLPGSGRCAAFATLSVRTSEPPAGIMMRPITWAITKSTGAGSVEAVSHDSGGARHSANRHGLGCVLMYVPRLTHSLSWVASTLARSGCSRAVTQPPPGWRTGLGREDPCIAISHIGCSSIRRGGRALKLGICSNRGYCSKGLRKVFHISHLWPLTGSQMAACNQLLLDPSVDG